VLFEHDNNTQAAIQSDIVDVAVRVCHSNTRDLSEFKALVAAYTNKDPDGKNVRTKALGLFVKRIGLRVTKDGNVAINSKSKAETIGSREWLDDIKKHPWFEQKKEVKTWKDISDDDVKFDTVALVLRKLAFKGEAWSAEDIYKAIASAERKAQETDGFNDWCNEYVDRNPEHEDKAA
jgi:hypothetical protein